MKLSPDFSLWEFERSQTASRAGIQNKADAEAVANLTLLCLEVLQPIRDELGPININSGYRGITLNRRLGSSDKSHHVKGMAADIEAFGCDNLELANFIVDSGLPFTQCLLECYRMGEPRSGWVHLSYDPDDVRMEVLTYANGKWLQGLPER